VRRRLVIVREWRLMNDQSAAVTEGYLLLTVWTEAGRGFVPASGRRAKTSRARSRAIEHGVET
jgi:hypothetical protein